jgi:hypothetical protein
VSGEPGMGSDGLCMFLKWLALRDSNPRLADYEPAVLTS